MAIIGSITLVVNEAVQIVSTVVFVYGRHGGGQLSTVPILDLGIYILCDELACREGKRHVYTGFHFLLLLLLHYALRLSDHLKSTKSHDHDPREVQNGGPCPCIRLFITISALVLLIHYFRRASGVHHLVQSK